MPRISQFFGITIAMYFNDHVPPHFHARYGTAETTIAIDSLAVLRGELPKRAHALVLEWAASHRNELHENWERARQGVPLEPIAPLE